jgi:TetR/AcrR family transcriptional regulator
MQSFLSHLLPSCFPDGSFAAQAVVFFLKAMLMSLPPQPQPSGSALEAAPDAMTQTDGSCQAPESALIAIGAQPVKHTKKPKPGERRMQILQALAAMLEQTDIDRVTTAALAARLAVSEAALYRHFASKAQMYEGLLDFIEQSVFTLVQKITGREVMDIQAPVHPVLVDGRAKAGHIMQVLLQFAEHNPGMARVMVGDVLQLEHERLQQRMVLFFDRIESSLRLCLRGSSATPTVDAQIAASILTSFAVGKLHRYVRSGFKRSPTEHLDASLARLLAT